MKYAVEARIFSNGKIVAKVRPAKPDEEDRIIENNQCDIWVDIFEKKEDAEDFCKQYKKA